MLFLFVLVVALLSHLGHDHLISAQKLGVHSVVRGVISNPDKR